MYVHCYLTIAFLKRTLPLRGFSALTRKLQNTPKLLIVLITFLNTSCSWSSRYEPSPAEVQAILEVYKEYVRNIVVGNSPHVESMISWALYDRGGKRTPEILQKQIASIKGRFPLQEHPLLLRAVKDLKVDESAAFLQLEKEGSEELVIINFVWEGSGWYISDDNLFGENAVVPRLAQLATQAKQPSNLSSSEQKAATP